MIVLIDNYDSFAHNLARYLRRLQQTTHVVRNDAVSVTEIRQRHPDLIVISPGPKRPTEAGVCLEVVRQLGSAIPIFGVCLGHQVIAEALGGRVVRGAPCHGQASRIFHDGSALFQHIVSPFRAGRYHSLVVDAQTLPHQLAVTARTADGTVMAIEHRRSRLAGVQFHPESVLTPDGYRLLANVLRWAGLEVPAQLPSFENECAAPRPKRPPVLESPITF